MSVLENQYEVSFLNASPASSRKKGNLTDEEESSLFLQNATSHRIRRASSTPLRLSVRNVRLSNSVTLQEKLDEPSSIHRVPLTDCSATDFCWNSNVLDEEFRSPYGHHPSGTLISSSTPVVSFSPPSELSDQSGLKENGATIDGTRGEHLSALDLRVDTKKSPTQPPGVPPQKTWRQLTDTRAAGGFDIKTLLTNTDATEPVCDGQLTQEKGKLDNVPSVAVAEPDGSLRGHPWTDQTDSSNLLLQALSTLVMLTGQQTIAVRSIGGTQPPLNIRQNPAIPNVQPLNTVHSNMQSWMLDQGEQLVPSQTRKCTTPSRQSLYDNVNVCISAHSTSSIDRLIGNVAGKPTPLSAKNLYATVRRRSTPSCRPSDDDGAGKGPAIFYSPEPCDSKLKIRAMIERNDPKLKYVNDGAAIRNPFAVDRRVQLAYLTALLCVRTADGGYACKGCDRTTARLRPMQQHLLSHSASKFNLCVRCLKGFNDKYDMKRHTRKHTLVRPYVCPECGRSFSQRCSLEGHRKKIHKIRLGYSRNQRREAVRVCECCGFACCDTAQMLAHVVQMHPDSSSLPRLRRQLVRQEERKRCCLQSTRSTTEHNAMFDTFTNTCTGFVASTSCNDLNAVTSSGVKPEATAETPRTKIVEFNRMEYPYSFHASDTPLMYT